MTGAQAIEYIHSVSWRGSVPGLSRTRELLRRMGNPEQGLSFVHIAGTNGKGSTAAMLERVLRAAGYCTGLYTSPYLQRFHERMQVNGIPISDDALGEITAPLVPLAEGMEDHPTEFELVTCAALSWFARERCDLVVLETGLGGRLDSTNVIPPPVAAVITRIGLDHTRELGATLEEIAWEKAGILKPGSSAVLYGGQNPAALEVLLQRCYEREIPVRMAREGVIEVVQDTLDGQVFHYGQLRNLNLPLLGAHQRANAAVAIETLSLLRERGYDIPESAIREGLAAVRWPGRFELLRRAPVFIADGGHNPQCAEALRRNLEHYFPGRRVVFLVGVLADKDYAAELNILAPLAERFVATAPCHPRALGAHELGEYLARYGRAVTVRATAAEAVAEAVAQAGPDGLVCSFGSLYLTGEIRTCLMGKTVIE